MSPPSPASLKAIRDLLCAAFDTAGMRELVLFHVPGLGGGLDEIVDVRRGEEAVAFDLVNASLQKGVLLELVAGMKTMRPLHAGIKVLAERMIPGTTGIPPANWDDVRENAIRFNEQLKERREQFQYLNAYKNLHECLHQLQELQVGIKQAAEHFRTTPEDRLGLEAIATMLVGLITLARQSQQQLEDPDDVADWLNAFDKAVLALGKVAGPADLPQLDLALRTLDVLPNRQAGLNEELVKCAKRLKAERLKQMVDELLPRLATPGAAHKGIEELRGEIGKFRELCERLNGLIQDHNACQHADVAFTPALSLTRITTRDVVDWPVVKKELQALAQRRPANMYAVRVSQLLDPFETAVAELATNRFADLLDWFRRLFSRTDKELLDLTGNLVQQAATIDLLLRHTFHV